MSYTIIGYTNDDLQRSAVEEHGDAGRTFARVRELRAAGQRVGWQRAMGEGPYRTVVVAGPDAPVPGGPFTTEQIAAVAPSDHVVVTDENRASLSHQHAHHFTDLDRLRIGDVIWAPYCHSGNHLVVVWVGEQRAGLGRNGHDLVEGHLDLALGRLQLLADDGERSFDLHDGAVVREPR